jgi:hypothetical protein
MGFVPKVVYSKSVNYVCVSCESEYESLSFGYCDNSSECVGAELYDVITKVYYPAN